MEPNFNPYERIENPSSPRLGRNGNAFESAAMALGVVAIFSCLFLYGAYICGGLAILFALLSRGGQMKLSTKAKRGLVLGIVAIVLSTFLTVAAFMVLLQEFGSVENILREYCQQYNIDFEQEFGIFFQ